MDEDLPPPADPDDLLAEEKPPVNKEKV